MSKIVGFINFIQLADKKIKIEIFPTAEDVLRAYPDSSQTGIRKVELKLGEWALEPSFDLDQ